MKIAVVDDDKDTRKLLVSVLMYCVNREVISFEDGDALWRYMEASERPDLVITDIQMPGMNGLELVAKIKETWPEQICILMSGDSDFERAAIGAGADAFLCKPFNIKELFSIVDKFVVGEDAGNNGEVSSPVSAY